MNGDRGPKAFVGSSQEGLSYALAIQKNLRETDVRVWSQVFQLTKSALDNLLDALNRFDFAVFVFVPDDILVHRDETKAAVRDNIVFEFGLFLGRLGKERTFIIAPEEAQDFHLPSDLAGITMARFNKARAEQSIDAALGSACEEVRRAIESASRRPVPTAEGWLARLIEQHAGVRTPNPYALVVDLLKTTEPITGDVKRFLDARAMPMPVEELKMHGIDGTADLETFAAQVKEKRAHLTRKGATEVHLFYAGPAGAAALLGAFLDNWSRVKIYQKSQSSSFEGFYDYWAPLVKI